MYKMDYIVVHCSVSEFGGVDLIRQWHLERGWRDVGYNIVVPNGIINSSEGYSFEKDGLIQVGRGLNFDMWIDEKERGAHALGYNRNSAGICLIGNLKFTLNQFVSLYYFCKVMSRINPDIKIVGHYELDTARGKTCPNFDVDHFRSILVSHMIEEELRLTFLKHFPIKENNTLI